MAKLIVSIDSVVIQEVNLTKERTSVGRRPYNDVVIDNLAVSGEHAAIVRRDGGYLIEDLNSTNGSYLNGKAIKLERLGNADVVEIGKYKIKFLNEGAAESTAPGPLEQPLGTATIRVVSGSAAGRDLVLTKVVTTVGKPGVAVAAITKRPSGYVVAQVDGTAQVLLNGQALSPTPVPLQAGDHIDVAGTKMQFRTE